jgi:hypothetical protein
VSGQADIWRTVGQRIGPGIYEHRGALHVDAEEMCAHFGVPCTLANFKTLLEGIVDVAVELGVSEVVVVEDAGTAAGERVGT